MDHPQCGGILAGAPVTHGASATLWREGAMAARAVSGRPLPPPFLLGRCLGMQALRGDSYPPPRPH